jgi:NAD(P)H-dependent nitrite reductase small subunit
MSGPRWTHVCALDDILPDSGVAALVDGRQVALFRVRDGVHAIANFDPVSQANVLARGVVGDQGGELVVASPLYKQHFSLVTGQCLEEPAHSVPTYLARVSEGEVWVRGEAIAPRRHTGKPRLVVIGDGMAALRAIEELIELAPGAHEITVFGAEPRSGYNRVLLSSLLAGDRQQRDIVTHPPEWFVQQGLITHRGDPIVHIDRQRRLVRSRSGVEAGYDRLLIATGSDAVKLPVPGASLPGVMTFRDLQDVETMLAAATSHRHAVVIGGGLLGLEAANGLQRQGMEVSVVHLTGHLMDRQLDADAATFLQRELESRGLKFALSARTAAIVGAERVTGVRLEDGRELAADLVMMAIGVRPNIALAEGAGLRCERGILVDDTMLTYDPAIYAIGECVQHRNTTFGLVAPLWDHARVCAAHLAGRGVRRYTRAAEGTQLKVGGIDVFSAGDFAMAPECESLVLRDARRGVYKRLVISNDRLRGAVLFGDTRDGPRYLQMISDSEPVGASRDALLFGSTPA